MRELRNDKLLLKSKELYSNILKLKKVDIDNNYCANLFDWFNEVVIKILQFIKAKKIKHNKIKKHIRSHGKKYIG